MKTESQYLASELATAQSQILALASCSLSDRREARQAFVNALGEDLPCLQRAAANLFLGNYGCGQQQLAKRIAAAKRGNVGASLGQLIAAVEFNCPQREAMQAYNFLMPALQRAVDKMLAAEIEMFRKIVD